MIITKKHRYFINCRNILVLFFLFLLMFSCSGKIDKATNVLIIPRDSMVQIMADIHIADAILINALNNRRINVNSVPAYYSDILERHHISKQRFDISLRYYCEDLEELDNMYDEIIAILNIKQVETETKPKH